MKSSLLDLGQVGRIAVLGLCLLGAGVGGVTGRAGETSGTDPKALARWQAMRFGMFVHWGPVSLRGTEIGWSRGDQVPVGEYDALYQRFNPTEFKADAWVRTAKAAGMRYLVFTTKHHDGFAMWNTKVSDYNIMRSPFGRDVVKELADACQHQGLMLGFYHSICDWRNPDYPLGSPGGRSAKPQPDMDRYNQYLKAQLSELLTGYGRIGIAWFDGEWEAPWTVTRGADLARHVRGLQPGILVNNRVGKGREDMSGTVKAGTENPGDYDTPEQQVGRFNNQHPWESCITICEQWAWKPGDRLKSLKQCVQTLATCAGGDGNLLLNVGPMPNGEIEPRQVERLQEIGAWLKRNGVAIYNTRGGPYRPAAWGVSTCRGKTVYLHVLNWPAGQLEIPALNRRLLSARVLGGPKVAFHELAGGWQMEVPTANRQEFDTIVELRLAGTAFDAVTLAR